MGKDHLQLDYLSSPRDETNETIEESWTKEQEKESINCSLRAQDVSGLHSLTRWSMARRPVS